MPQEGKCSLRIRRIKVESITNEEKSMVLIPKIKKRTSEGIKKEFLEVKSQRQCEKSGCRKNATNATCFTKINLRCASYVHNTSRWYHISDGEHYCNECFEHFYRSSKGGYQEYARWKSEWTANSNSEASVKVYMMDQRLPYWIKCNKSNCQKWRELPFGVDLTNDLIASFTCTSIKKLSVTCDTTEDPRVSRALEPTWLEHFLAQPLLKNSPAADLLGAYYSDGVGLSPTCSRCVKALKIYQEHRKQAAQDNEVQNSRSFSPKLPGLNPHFEPFYQPAEQGRALCVRPDVIGADEEEAFSYICRRFPSMYLGIRNLIITLWNLDCKNWLTDETVQHHIIVRGLVRLQYCIIAKSILQHFTEKGVVNLGVVDIPKLSPYIPLKYQRTSVIVIGAGISGLGAARHLKNLGFQTLVLEARNRIGGRIWDDESLGVCVGKGAQIVTGVINNPITFICEQTGLDMRFLGERCDLFASNGEAVDAKVDKDIEFHFNNSLDVVANWRKTATKDESLYTKILEAHKQLVRENGITVTEEKMRLFRFHLSNLEYACGASLLDVSAKFWDQNETYEQFSGDHAMLWKGYSAVINKLAAGLDIQLGKIVKLIDYSSDNEVKVILENGFEFVANKVLVTVPLALLQLGDVSFNPPLPKKKEEALKSLGAGVMEKVVLKYSKCFWRSKINGADFFGCISPKEEDRGQFPLFCDVSKYGENDESSSYVLTTCLCGDAVKLIHTKTDEEIVAMCADVLKKLFPDENVPDPINYFVTKWSQDQFSKMVYSYVKLGSNGEEYDVLAADIQRKVFFAGEGTNRRHPQTVTGAYNSGLREAYKIIKSL